MVQTLEKKNFPTKYIFNIHARVIFLILAIAVVVVVVVRLYFKRATLDSNKTDKLVALRKKKKNRNKIKITEITKLKI